MGLVDETTFRDLRKLGKIRNRFAHHHVALEFDDAEVVKLCDSLSLNHDPIDVATGKPMKLHRVGEALRVRTRFLMMTLYLGDKFVRRSDSAL